MTPLLVLPGALGGLEGSAIGAGRLAQGRQVAALGYGPEDDFEALMGRVREAADRFGGEQFDLLGQSYGGWIAQCAAARWPARVRRLVLSHSFALEPGEAAYFAFGERILRTAPAALLAPLIRWRVRRALGPVRQALPELYRRQDAAVAQMARSPRFLATLAAQQRCLRESLATSDAGRVSGLPVLIIESANDPLIRPAARARLRRRFPAAQVHRFERAGHVSAVVEADTYADLVDGFLRSPSGLISPADAASS